MLTDALILWCNIVTVACLLTHCSSTTNTRHRWKLVDLPYHITTPRNTATLYHLGTVLQYYYCSRLTNTPCNINTSYCLYVYFSNNNTTPDAMSQMCWLSQQQQQHWQQSDIINFTASFSNFHCSLAPLHRKGEGQCRGFCLSECTYVSLCFI